MSVLRDTSGDDGGPQDPPRIWILVLALSIGGAEQTIVELVNGMDREKFDVTIWTVFGTNPLAGDLEDDVQVKTLGVAPTRGEEAHEITGVANPAMYLLAPLSFLRTVRRENPDVLHSFLFYDNITSRIAGLVSPSTTVITGERGFHNSLGVFSRILDRITLPLSDVIVSNSRAGADYYAERGVDRSNLRVIPNGRDLERYRDATSDGVRNEFDVPPGVPLVGTVGRLVERKGHRDLLRAWAGVMEANPDAHLLIVGHGPKRDSFEAVANDLDIEATVHFTGSRSDVPELLDAMDLFVFPSHWEGLPGAILEAMAAGLPIVATRVTGNVELLSDGSTGILVPAHDPIALGTSIQRLLSDTQHAGTLGQRAQNVAFERYTRERMVQEFEGLYDDLTAPLLQSRGCEA